MGYYLNATLIYGCPAPEDWGWDEAEEACEGPLVYAADGSGDWPPEEVSIILGVKGSASTARETGAPIGDGPIPLPDVRQIVNAGKLYRHVTGQEWKPQWWLLPSGG